MSNKGLLSPFNRKRRAAYERALADPIVQDAIKKCGMMAVDWLLGNSCNGADILRDVST